MLNVAPSTVDLYKFTLRLFLFRLSILNIQFHILTLSSICQSELGIERFTRKIVMISRIKNHFILANSETGCAYIPYILKMVPSATMGRLWLDCVFLKNVP